MAKSQSLWYIWKISEHAQKPLNKLAFSNIPPVFDWWFLTGGSIERSTDIKIKCCKCGNEYSMDMMRMGPNGRNLVCRNCLERKPSQKQELAKVASDKAQKPQEPSMKEYFCKACKYNFSRAKYLRVSTCPYCGASGSLMVKGSTAKIIADVSKMKGD